MRNQGACSRIDAHIVAPLAAVPSGRAQVPELDDFLLLLVQRDVADRSGAEPVSNVPPGSLGLCYQSIYSSAGHSCVLPSSIALWPSGATVSRQVTLGDHPKVLGPAHVRVAKFARTIVPCQHEGVQPRAIGNVARRVPLAVCAREVDGTEGELVRYEAARCEVVPRDDGASVHHALEHA